MPFVIWKAKTLNQNEVITPDVLLPGLGIPYRVLASRGNIADNGEVLAKVLEPISLEGFTITEVSENEAAAFIIEGYNPSPDYQGTSEELAATLMDPPVVS